MASPFTYGAHGAHGPKRPAMSSQSSTHSTRMSLSSSSMDGSDRYFDTVSPSQLLSESYQRRRDHQGSQDSSGSSSGSSSDSDSESDGSARSPGSSSRSHARKYPKHHRHFTSRKSRHKKASRKKARPPQLGPDEIKLEDLLACANKALRRFMRQQKIVHELLSEPMSGPLSYLGPMGCVVRLLYRAASRGETLAAWHARRHGIAPRSDDLASSSHSVFALPDTAPRLKDDRWKLAASAIRASKPGAKPKPADPGDAAPGTSLFAEASLRTADSTDSDGDGDGDGDVWDAIAKGEKIDAGAGSSHSMAMPMWQAITKKYSSHAAEPEPDSTADGHPLLSPPPPAVRAWKSRADFGSRRKISVSSMATITEPDKESMQARAIRPPSNALELFREKRPSRSSRVQSSVSQMKLEELNDELSKSDQLNVSLAKLVIIARDALLEAEGDIDLLEAMNEKMLGELQGGGKTKSELLDEVDFHKSRFESCHAEFQHVAEWASYLEAAIDQSEDRDLIKDCASYYFVEGQPAEKPHGEPTPPKLKAYFAEMDVRLQGMARAAAKASGGASGEASKETSLKDDVEDDNAGVDEGDVHGDNDDNGADVEPQGENMADWFTPLASVPGSALSWHSLHSLHSLHSSFHGSGTGSARHSTRSNLRGSLRGSTAGRILLARSNSAGSTRPRRGPGNYLKRPRQLDASFGMQAPLRMQEIHTNQSLDPVSESAEPDPADELPALVRSVSEPVEPISGSFVIVPEYLRSPETPTPGAPIAADPPASPNNTDPGFKSLRSARSFRPSNKARSSRSRRTASISSAGSRNSDTSHTSSASRGGSSVSQTMLSASSKKTHKPRVSSLSLKKGGFPKPESPPAGERPRLEAVETKDPLDISGLPAVSPPAAIVDNPTPPVDIESAEAAEAVDVPESPSMKPEYSSHGDLRQRIRARREVRGKKAFIGVALPSIYLSDENIEEPKAVAPVADSAGPQDGQASTGVTRKYPDTHLSISMQSIEVVPVSIPLAPLSIVVQTVCDIVPDSLPETAPELPERIAHGDPAVPRRHYFLPNQPKSYPGITNFVQGIIYLVIAWLWRQKTNAYLILHWYSVVHVRPSLPRVRAVLEAVTHATPALSQLWNRVVPGYRAPHDNATLYQLDAPAHDPPPPYSPRSPTPGLPASSGESSIRATSQAKPLEPEVCPQVPFPIEALADLVGFVVTLATVVVLNLAITERNLWIDNNANLPREYLYTYIMQYDRDTGSCATNPYMFSSFSRSRYSSPPATHSPYHLCACVPTFVDPRIVLEPMGNSWVSFLDMLGDYRRFYSPW